MGSVRRGLSRGNRISENSVSENSSLFRPAAPLDRPGDTPENSNFPACLLARKRLLAPLLILPSPAVAQSCADLRPGWDGAPVSAFSEALLLFSTPLSLILLLATAIVLRLRSNWGALGIAIGWSLQVYLVTFVLPPDAARAEGCVGSPVLFILAAAVLAVGAVIYTGPPPKPDNDAS